MKNVTLKTSARQINGQTRIDQEKSLSIVQLGKYGHRSM